MATRIQRVIFNAGAWAPRPTPRRAIMPISVTVEGDTADLVPDLCHELSREFTWAEYGETVIPADAAPARRHHETAAASTSTAGC